MNEKDLIQEGTKIVTEVIKGRAKDIYDDGLKPVTKESGQALAGIVGLFNHVVLHPIKKANLTFKYKLEQFENDLKNKLKSVPEEKLIEPPLTIAGPAIESLKYTFDEKELRDMYLSLLASAMNVDKVEHVHPSFSQLIKEMSPIDAKVLSEAANLGQIPCARISIKFDNQVFSKAIPRLYLPDLIKKRDPFVVSASVENLCRLGLLVHRDNTINGYNYNEFKDHAFIQNQLKALTKVVPDKELKVEVNGEVILLTDLGTMFKNSCMD